MTDRQKEEFRMNIIMLLASAKFTSDQSTYIQGELHHELKQDYNLMIKSIDRFIKTVEGKLGDGLSQTLTEITDAFNNKASQIRKEINELA